MARAVGASLDDEPEAAWARRALARVTDRRRAWRLLTSRGFPEEVITDVLGDPD